jgi:hypothetical protein
MPIADYGRAISNFRWRHRRGVTTAFNSNRNSDRCKANMNKNDAEGIAVDALTFIASDAARLARFLDLSGLTPASIRAAARDVGFLLGVLDYVDADETLLKAFADASGISPSIVAKARLALGGQSWE